MKYRTDDGIDLSGDDFREIVRELRRASPLAPETNERDYMRAVSKRIGRGVRYDRPANFVADLVKLGYLIKVEREQ